MLEFEFDLLRFSLSLLCVSVAYAIYRWVNHKFPRAVKPMIEVDQKHVYTTGEVLGRTTEPPKQVNAFEGVAGAVTPAAQIERLTKECDQLRQELGTAQQAARIASQKQSQAADRANRYQRRCGELIAERNAMRNDKKYLSGMLAQAMFMLNQQLRQTGNSGQTL